MEKGHLLPFWTMAMMAGALAFSWGSEVMGHILRMAEVSPGQILGSEDLGEQAQVTLTAVSGLLSQARQVAVCFV